MNPRERVFCALSGSPADRVPLSLTSSLLGAELTSCPRERYYTDASAFLEGQAAVVAALQPDLVYGPFSAGVEGAAFGATLRYLHAQAPNLIRPALPALSALDQLPSPGADNPHLRYLTDSVRGLVRAHGATRVVGALCLSPLDLPVMLLGMEGWFEAIVTDDPAVPALLDRCAAHCLRHARRLMDQGADVLVMPVPFLSRRLVPPTFIHAHGLPRLTQVLTEIGQPVVLHSGGMPLLPALPDLATLPHVVGFVVTAHEDLAQARQLLGPGPLLLGNLDGPGLHYLRPDELRAAAQAALEATRHDPSFILATSGPDIPIDVDIQALASLHTLLERP